MANVTGPTTNLPGYSRPSPSYMKCDNHPDRKASFRITTECDSYGSEEEDLCQECTDKMKEAIAKQRDSLQHCEWCNTMKQYVRPFRDPDEGSAGPLYDVCPECRSRRISEFCEDED